MPLIEFRRTGDGKIQAIPTTQEYVPTELEERAALDVQLEADALQARWDGRRGKFFAWALKNPRELDLLLDECEKYGVILSEELDASL